MTALHIVQGDIDNGDKARIEKAARDGLDAPMWTVPKHATPGDDVVMYVRGYGFFATATIKSEPKPRDDWPNRYGAGLTAIELIEPAISLDEIIHHVPSLTWANYPRSITTPDANVASQIRKLIQNRRTTQTPDLDEDSLMEANSDELRHEMARFWTCHWQFRYWRPDMNDEGDPVCSSWSNLFTKRGVQPGDIAYILSMSGGQLYLGGRMTVKQVLSKAEYAQLRNLDIDSLFNAAEECILDPDEETGTLLHLHRRLSPALTKQLRFQTKTETKEPFFDNETDLNKQATRGIRELTPESAAFLDRIIEITDRWPKSDQLITVTEEQLLNGPVQDESRQIRLPEEVPSDSVYTEGSVQRILINRYERDPRAREECIRYYGTKCFLCPFDFVAVYGDVMVGFIHVHHLNLLSSLGADYEVDPIQDLRPVCPNCHAVLHHRPGELPYSLEEVSEMLQKCRK